MLMSTTAVREMLIQKSTLELEEKSSRIKDKDSVYGQPEYDQFKGYPATQLEILKSVSSAEALVARMNLLDRPEFISEQGTLTALSSVLSTVLSSLNGDKNAVAPPESRDARIRIKVSFTTVDGPGLKTTCPSAFLTAIIIRFSSFRTD